MAKHRLPKEGRRRSRLFGSRPVHDDLFERSFSSCYHCGQDVYVLAEDCRSCGASLQLRTPSYR